MFGKTLPDLTEKVDIHRESDYLLAALSEMESAQERLAINIRTDLDRPAYVWGVSENTGSAARQLAAFAMTAMRYQDGQDSSGSLEAPGIIGIDPLIVEDVQWINALKQRVQLLIRRLNQHEKGPERERLAKVLLNNNGWKRIHRKQVYRQIRLLDCKPEYVGFSWAKVRKVYKLTAGEVRERLMNDHVALVSMLDDIPDHERMALVKEMPVHARANVLFTKREDVERNGFTARDISKEKATYKEIDTRRIPMNTPIPLLYPAKRGSALPRYHPLGEKTTGPPRKRVNTTLEETPVCLNYHRYKGKSIK